MKRSVALGISIVLGLLGVSACSESETSDGGGGGDSGGASSGGSNAGTGGGHGGAGLGGAGGENSGSGGASNPEGRVSGRVVDPWGAPWKQLDVLVDGELFSTDDQGVFVVEGAGRTYDLAVRGGMDDSVSAWLGLSRRDPVVVLERAPTLGESVRFQGALSGQVGSSARVEVVVSCDTGETATLQTIEFNYDFSLTRFGGGTKRCVLFAYEKGQSARDGMISFVAHPIEIEEDTRTFLYDLELARMLDSPSGVSLDFSFEQESTETPAPTLRWGNVFLPMQLLVATPTDTRWRVHLPDLSQRIEFRVLAGDEAMTFSGQPDQDFLTAHLFRFELSRRLKRAAPEPDAQVPRDSTFRVLPGGEGAYCFEFLSSSPDRKVVVCSRDTEIQLPDYSKLGVSDFEAGLWRASFFAGRDYEKLPSVSPSGYAAEGVSGYQTSGLVSSSAPVGFRFETN